MADRYFVESPIRGERATLVGPEAHHLAHVLRAKPGDEVTLFDGSGAEFWARVEKVGRSEIELAIVGRRELDRALLAPITLGVALPKGDRQRWLVEKVVELGVARIVPLQTARSVAEAGSGALARLRRTVIEASKQCGRNRLAQIDEPMKVAEFFSATQSLAAGQTARLLADPEAPAGVKEAFNNAAAFELAIGPEGGFTPEEVALAKANGWRGVSLGPRILRVETAAILLVGLASQGHGNAGCS